MVIGVALTKQIKAFRADGLKVNWSLWATHFSHYARRSRHHAAALGLVYGGAITSCGRIEDGGNWYVQWLEWDVEW